MKVKELLTSASKWTIRAMARDKSDVQCTVEDSDVFCFCLLGAIYHCYDDYDDRRSVVRKVLRAINADHFEDKELAVTVWNDHPDRTFQEVKALVERLDI